MSATATKKINAAFKHEDWTTARRVLKEELKKDPQHHWLLTRMAMTYYEQHNYQKALDWNVRALRVLPTCPLVRWDHACILDMLDKTTEAISEWHVLLSAGPKAIADDPCGEGLEWAESLLNDCRYRLASASFDNGDTAAALHYLRSYLKSRRTGVSSIFDEHEAEQRLTLWKRRASPRASARDSQSKQKARA